MASELSPVPADLEIEATIRRLEITQQIFDRYKLLRILGRGGMGVVWLAHDERLDRDVALKFLPDEVGFDPEAEDEMKRETRRCLDLTHPNIIRIYDFVKDRQAAAISMEYIDGKTLSGLKIERPKRVFDVEELRPWLTQTCQALAYAHADVGIIHRDLKPGNLMLTSRGQIKIADFGIAQGLSDSIARTTMRRGTSGTVSYMSPQQMNGDAAAVTDDVYAMGATIYELLTSKPPFYSGNVSFQLRVMVAPTMRERRDELEIRSADIPAEWEEAIAACLAKTPEERPGSMQELAERLGLVRVKPSVPAAPEPKPVEGLKEQAAVFLRSAGHTVRQHVVQLASTAMARRKLALLTGSTLVLSAALVAAWQYVFWPQLAPRAELSLATSPPGATVHIEGRPDAITPVTVSGLRIGSYAITVTAEGFDPVHSVVELKPGAKLDLGTIALQRAYGQWVVTSLPAHCHYTLTGDAGTGNFVRSGTTPDLASDIPSGTYVLNVTSAKLGPWAQTIKIPPHGLKTQKIDLIAASVVGNANDSAARAFRGEIPAASLEGPDKSELMGYYNRAFALYLANDFLAAAAEQIQRLQDLKADVSPLLTALEAKRAAKEAEVSESVSRLISANKLASAARVLQGGADELDEKSVAQLKARFQPSLQPYQEKIDALLKSLPDNAPALAQAQLAPWLAQYPDDLGLQLALAQLLTQLQPSCEPLAKQLEVLHRLAASPEALAGDAHLSQVISTLQDELLKLDARAKAVADAKTALEAETNKITHLQDQKEAYENRRVGRRKANPFASTLNFFGKVVTGHSVVDTEAMFATSEQKEDAISSVQQEIDTEKLKLPAIQAALDDAQKNYTAFATIVPWDQGAAQSLKP